MIDMIYGCAKAVAMGCVGIYGVIRLREEIAKRKAENYCVNCTRCKAIDGDGKVYCRLEGELDKQPRYCHLHTTESEPQSVGTIYLGEQCKYGWQSAAGVIWCEKRKRQCYCIYVCNDFEPGRTSATHELQKTVHETINKANEDKGIRYEQF